MPRQRMSGTARRAQLIEVARSLFAERGLAGSSIEEIAGRAEVAKPAVYEHFGNKDGLYKAVVDAEIDQLVATLTATMSVARTPRELTEAGIVGLLNFVEDHTEGFQILSRDSPIGSTSYQSIMAGVSRLIEDTLAEQFAAAGLDPAEAPMYAQMMFGMIAQTGRWWLDNRDVAKEHVAAHLLNLAWNGMSGLRVELPTLPGPRVPA